MYLRGRGASSRSNGRGHGRPLGSTTSGDRHRDNLRVVTSMTAGSAFIQHDVRNHEELARGLPIPYGEPNPVTSTPHMLEAQQGHPMGQPYAQTTQTGSIPADMSSSNARPAKRMRAAQDIEPPRPPVVIAYPAQAIASDRGTEPESPQAIKERLDLLIEAQNGVQRRLDGHLPERDPKTMIKPSDKTADDSLRKYLDFDHGTVPTMPNETADETARRETLNRFLWVKKAAKYNWDIGEARKDYALAKGLVIIGEQFERPNHLYNVGYLWAPVFVDNSQNTVLFGKYTGEAIDCVTGGRALSSEMLYNRSAVYRMAPRGYPTSPYEVERLVNLSRSQDSNTEDIAGAHVLLRAFYTAVKRIDPSLYDDSMKCILDSKVYNPKYYPSCVKGIDAIVPFVTMPPKRIRRSNGSNDGYGLPMPEGEANILNINAWSEYLLMHHTLGTDTAVNGVTMNFGAQVLRETVFGSRLARALSPVNQAARTAFTFKFAYLCARPHLYAEYVEEYNKRNPGAPLHPAVGPPYTFTPIRLSASRSQNFTTDDLCEYLIEERMPIELIDHCYAYGRQFLDHVFHNTGRYDEAKMVDDERMERLREWGVPPKIPHSALAGWWSPSYDNVRRLKYLYHKNPAWYNLDNDPFWLRYGEDPVPVILASRPGIKTFTPRVWGSNPEDVEMTGEDQAQASHVETESPEEAADKSVNGNAEA